MKTPNITTGGSILRESGSQSPCRWLCCIGIYKIEHLYETGFQHLEKFISEYGIEALKSNCVCDDGYNLGRWIANCKAKFRKGKLAEKYAVRFEKLGIRLGKEQ